MAEKILKTVLKINKNTEEKLTSSNPVLKNGEVVLSTVSPSASESPEIVLMRIGDGKTNYNNLPWLSGLAADVYDWAKADKKPTYGANEIKFTDGENFQQKYDKGQLKGQKGDTGARGPVGAKGDTGATPAVTATATVDTNIGIPAVEVIKGGTTTNPSFEFQFKNLKGQKGDKGNPGEKGAQGIQGIQGPKGADGLTTSVTVGATKYTHSNGNITIPAYPTLDSLKAAAKEHIHKATDVTQDATHKFVTDSQISSWNSKASTSVASGTANGLMSSTDKTKLDGIAVGANNYSLPAAGSSLGGVKTGGDVSIASGVITVNDNSHNHTIGNVSGLQSALDSKIATSKIGAASGVASLGTDGKVPSSQLPSYVDDVVEGYYSGGKFYKETGHSTVITGETGKIYVDLHTNKTFRWSGTAYVEISSSIVIGTGSGTALDGKIGTDHINNKSNPHGVTKAQLGLGSVENKSSATIRGELTKENVITALGYTPPTTNTTYGVATTTANGLMSSSDKGKLDGIATGATRVIVDSSLSSSSTNAIQNKVVYAALNGKAPTSHTHQASQVTFTDGKTFQQKLDDESLRGPQGPKGDQGIQGPQGATGPRGATGATGSIGPQGPRGYDGSNGTSAAWFTGTAVSGTSSSSVYGAVSGSKANDMYLNSSYYNVYRCTSPNYWVYVCNIRGAQGYTGSTGPQGPKGATGATGPQGPQGPRGYNGADGLTTSIRLNGYTYTQSGGQISLPSYPTLSSLGAASSNHTHNKSQITGLGTQCSMWLNGTTLNIQTI